MKRKQRKNKVQYVVKKENKSIEYTIAELIELGEKKNSVKLASPLYEKKNN